MSLREGFGEAVQNGQVNVILLYWLLEEGQNLIWWQDFLKFLYVGFVFLDKLNQQAKRQYLCTLRLILLLKSFPLIQSLPQLNPRRNLFGQLVQLPHRLSLDLQSIHIIFALGPLLNQLTFSILQELKVLKNASPIGIDLEESWLFYVF